MKVTSDSPRKELSKLQVVPRKQQILGTTVLTALEVHGRTLGNVARYEGIGLNEAVAMLLRDVREEREKVFRAAFAEGKRQGLRVAMFGREAA